MMLKEFREFMLKGEFVVVAVGLVMALATFSLVTAIVENLVMPAIMAILGEPSFDGLTLRIGESEFRFGGVISAAIAFIAVSAAVYFFVLVPYQRYRDRMGASTPTRECPECATSIAAVAKRCPNCTSAVQPGSV